MDLDGFRKYLIENDRSQNTIESYLLDLGVFSKWFQQTNGEELSPSNLTSADLRQYRQYMVTVEKARPATINRKLASIRAYIRWAVESGQLENSPLKGIHNVDEQELAPRWLDKKQQAALLRETEREVLAAKTATAKWISIRNQTITIFILNAGARISEVCDLVKSDIELNDRSGRVRIRKGKGSKYRTIPLNRAARNSLREWLAVRPKCPKENLFIGKKGEAITPSGYQRWLSEIGRKINLEVTPHILRHCALKNLLDATGGNLSQVSAIAGHKSINTTQRYVTPGENDLQNAVNLLDE